MEGREEKYGPEDSMSVNTPDGPSISSKEEDKRFSWPAQAKAILPVHVKVNLNSLLGQLEPWRWNQYVVRNVGAKPTYVA